MWKIKVLQLKEHEKMQRKHCHPKTWKDVTKALQSKKHEKVVAKAKDGLEDVKEGIEGAVEGLKNNFKK